MWSRSSRRLAVKSKTWNPTQSEWMLAAQCIQPEEKERIGKFVFKRDAKAAMVGRLLIRRVVSSMLGMPYRCVKLGRTDKGKPCLLSSTDGSSQRLGCNFNISHQGDFVVLAAESSKLVGVDIMKVEWPPGSSSVADFFRTMDRQLTAREWSSVKRRSGDMEQLKAFYRFWCLKESYVKALGTGIGFEVSRLDFDTAGQELRDDAITRSTRLHVDGKLTADWLFQETLLENHCVAVATTFDRLEQIGQVPQDEGRFIVWSVQELLSGCEPLLGSQPDLAYWENFQARQEEPGCSR